MSEAIRPFTVAVPQPALDQLRQKLALTRLPDELCDAGWSYGVPLTDIKRLAHHWQHNYDWRAAERTLNALPQFTTTVPIDGFDPLELHFIHARSPRPNAIPLLFVHGWPGSFIEVTKLLPLLTDPASSDDPAFHVVAPSLPNYGFSEGVTQRGFSRAQYAQAVHRIMLRCGYGRYVAQGGDWGMIITRQCTVDYPDHCLAQHTNIPFADPPTLFSSPMVYATSLWEQYVAGFDEMTKRLMARQAAMNAGGRGYSTLQGTKPQTLGYAQADSPVALLAWIYEKLHDWTDEYPWSDDEVLTWVSIHWFSRGGPAASSRIYYETAHDKTPRGALSYNRGPKYGLARFPGELGGVPRSWHATLGDVVRFTDMKRGGHFAAYEVPEDLAREIRAMFAPGSRAFGVVPGLNGY